MNERHSKERVTLPASEFARPGQRYKIEDKAHASNALARIAQFGTATMQYQVREAVKRKFPTFERNKK